MKATFEIPLLTVCLFLPQNFIVTQSSAPVQNTSTEVPTNIHQLFLDDQAERTVRGVVFGYGPDVNSRDALRRAEAKILLLRGELKTAQDFHDAAFIFQHGQSADDYLLAHVLAVEAIVKGDASSKWIAAATLDRYLQAIGQRQVFGTQYPSKGYAYLLQHPNAINNPETKQTGATQDPYDRTLVPDTLRGDFCVPTRADQQSNLDEIDARESR